jgi:hypothetical protein
VFFGIPDDGQRSRPQWSRVFYTTVKSLSNVRSL